MSQGDVLVVDDEPIALQMLGGVLQEAGYEVRASTDGERALRLAAQQRPDLVLLDLSMPGMDGFEVCRRLRADPATQSVPVIVLSAIGEVDDKVRAFQEGAADYVTKPFEPREVLSRVGAHVQLYRLRRELEESHRELEAQNRELQRKNEELVQAERRTHHVFSALAAALPGTVLDGRYRLEEKIGSGGYATVFRAEHVALAKKVAVKVFRPFAGNDTPQALARFRAEGVAACRVQHPNAVVVLDCGISSTGIAYLVMELLDGQTVGALLNKDGLLEPRRALRIAAEVCDALAAAHDAGLVHRDIKPDNVFLHRAGGEVVVKVLDFGIAKLMEASAEAPSEPQLTRGILGTPTYLSPERVMGLDYDGRADVYSLGVMLYQMLSGRPPFPSPRGEDVYGALMRQVTEEPPPLDLQDPALEALLARTMAKEPRRRPTASELALRLRTLANRQA